MKHINIKRTLILFFILLGGTTINAQSLSVSSLKPGETYYAEETFRYDGKDYTCFYIVKYNGRLDESVWYGGDSHSSYGDAIGGDYIAIKKFDDGRESRRFMSASEQPSSKRYDDKLINVFRYMNGKAKTPTLNIRLATAEEKHWLNTCIAAGDFVSMDKDNRYIRSNDITITRPLTNIDEIKEGEIYFIQNRDGSNQQLAENGVKEPRFQSAGSQPGCKWTRPYYFDVRASIKVSNGKMKWYGNTLGGEYNFTNEFQLEVTEMNNVAHGTICNSYAIIRPATQEEKEWLRACTAAGKLLPGPGVKATPPVKKKEFPAKGAVQKGILSLSRTHVYFKDELRGFEFHKVPWQYQFVNCNGEIRLTAAYEQKAEILGFRLANEVNPYNQSQVGANNWPQSNEITISEIKADLYLHKGPNRYAPVALGTVYLNYLRTGDLGTCSGTTINVMKELGKNPGDEEYLENIAYFELRNIVVVRGDAMYRGPKQNIIKKLSFDEWGNPNTGQKSGVTTTKKESPVQQFDEWGNPVAKNKPAATSATGSKTASRTTIKKEEKHTTKDTKTAPTKIAVAIAVLKTACGNVSDMGYQVSSGNGHVQSEAENKAKSSFPGFTKIAREFNGYNGAEGNYLVIVSAITKYRDCNNFTLGIGFGSSYANATEKAKKNLAMRNWGWDEAKHGFKTEYKNIY